MASPTAMGRMSGGGGGELGLFFSKATPCEVARDK